MLIPLVEYNIDLNGTDPMNPASMTIEGADAPSRLLYEVGLKESVDLLNLSTTATDNYDFDSGKFVFYTNDWSSLYKENSNEIIDYSYSTNRNTISFFSPSVDNENYYYHIDTEIYSDRNGTLYKGANAPDPNGNYYHRVLVYEKSQNGTVNASYVYEPVSEYVLSHTDDLKKQDDNSWIILRGTLHHFFGTYIREKGAGNHTETVHVSDMPFVHDAAAGITPDEYHVDSYLGNNGKLVLDAPEGIKITKKALESITNRLQSYSFRISINQTLEDDLLLVKETAEGIRSYQTVNFSGGIIDNITLKHNESAYLLGAPLKGVEITVEEVISQDSAYEIKTVKINGVNSNNFSPSVEVENDFIATVEFTNDYLDISEIEITPTTATISGEKVLSVLSGNKTLQKDAFEFELWSATLSGEDLVADRLLETVKNSAPTSQNRAPFSFTELIFDSLQNEDVDTYYYIIKEKIPSGVIGNKLGGITYDTKEYGVKIEVTDINSGRDIVLSAAVTLLEGNSIVFNNTYEADEVKVDLSGKKTLLGDTIDENEFNFSLYPARWDDATNSVVKTSQNPIKTVQNAANGNILFSSSEISELNFSQTGAYRFIIEEVNGGAELTEYDKSVYYVKIDVTDNLLGKLVATTRVSKVDEKGTTTEATGNTINFENVRTIEPITVPIKGTKKYNKPFSAGTFSFSLYQAINQNGNIVPAGDAVLSADNQTPQGGSADFEFKEESYAIEGGTATTAYLTFSQAGTYYFVVKEALPEGVSKDNPTKNGITYDTTEYILTVNITEGVQNGRTILIPEVICSGNGSITFNNVYSASAISGAIISGKKNLENKNLENNMFTFELFEATVENNEVTKGSPIEEVKNNGENFTFSEIRYTSLSDVGTHYYLIKEYIPDEKEVGMTYDETCYLVTITVSDNGDGTLAVSEPTYTVLDEEGNITENTKDNAIFNNSYETPEPPGEINPGTGVNNSLLWFACSLVVATGTVIFALPKKKEEQE